MDIKEILEVKKSFDNLGVDKVEKILIDWVYQLNDISFTIDTDEMAVIAGYTKYTLITEANMTSIRKYIDYILFSCIKFKKKQTQYFFR